MMNIYCISGLGADERVLKKLAIAGVNFIYLPWVKPANADTVASYAAKMAATIPEKDPVILGLSFGGMLGVEIAKIMPVKKLFLISSAKTKHELGEDPAVIRFLNKYKLIPFGILITLAKSFKLNSVPMPNMMIWSKGMINADNL